MVLSALRGAFGALRALRGALGFLTTIPVPADEDAWGAFRRRSEVIVVPGYVVGVLVSLPLLVAPSPVLGGFGFVLALYVVTGINHVDGLTDVADGLAVHGPESERVAAMRDSALGVGGALASGLVLLGLFAVGWELTTLGRGAVGIVVASEVAAKLSMLVVLVAGTPRHDGLGAALSTDATRWTLVRGGIFGAPTLALTWPSPAAGVALASGMIVAVSVNHLARRRFGGTSGDVLGATNEIARLVALLVGVLVWTLW